MENKRIKEERIRAFKMLTLLGIYFSIATIWALLDVLEFGSPQPSLGDTLVGFVLAGFVYKWIWID